MRVQVWMSQAGTVDRLEIPSDLLSLRSLNLGLGVVSHRPEGEPWARLVVFFVSVTPPENRTAQVGGPERG